MNARTQTQTATLAAMALTLALTASLAAAAPKAAERAKSTVACRTVASYDMSAWMAPTAVVLHSAGAWKAWNDEMAEAGMAVAPEAQPEGVDWAKESVVVLALGDGWEPRHLELKGASRNLSCTTVTVSMEAGRGGMSPALVMAMPKSAAVRVRLACTDGMAMPEARSYPETTLAASGDAQPLPAVATTWGAVKAEYR